MDHDGEGPSYAVKCFDSTNHTQESRQNAVERADRLWENDMQTNSL